MTSSPHPSRDDAPANVYETLVATARRVPELPVLHVLGETAAAYGIDAGEIGYAAALAKVDALRVAYEAAGWGTGHRVGLLLENRPDFLFHFFALNGLGASIVPINPDLRAKELEYLVRHSEMALAIAVPARHPDLRAAAEAVGSAMPTIGPEDAIPAPAIPAEAADTGREAEAAILYTSGTTGAPKGCVLTNTYFLQIGLWYRTMGGHCTLRNGEERMLTPLPLFHMNALACSVMAMLTTGGCLTVLDRFHPRTWWESVRAARATCIHYLGVMPPMLMSAPPSEADRDHAVRFGFGAGVPPQLHAPFEDRFGFPLCETWAMTETGAGGLVMGQFEPRFVGTACFGKPEAGAVEARVVRDDGSDADAGEPGELFVRRFGPDPRYGFFREYLKDPAATEEAWAGGWFHTGDIVTRDAAGYLRFIDRKKNVIRRSGENIASAEVEAALRQHEDVADVAVTPVPDDVRGDEVFVCILPKTMPADADRKARAIAAWALERMAYYKAPGYIAFVETLPVTSTNKVQRGALKTLAADLLESGRAIDLRTMKKRTA